MGRIPRLKFRCGLFFNRSCTKITHYTPATNSYRIQTKAKFNRILYLALEEDYHHCLLQFIVTFNGTLMLQLLFLPLPDIE